MTTRKQTLKHVYAVIDIPEDVQEALESLGINSVPALLSGTDEMFDALIDDETIKFTKWHSRIIARFRVWHAEKSQAGELYSFTKDLTEHGWDLWVDPSDRREEKAPTELAVETIKKSSNNNSGYARRSIDSFPKFDGKPEHFTTFKLLFMATTDSKGLGHMLEKDYSNTAPTDDELPQWEVNKSFLFSALLASCAKGTAVQFVTPQKADKHGIRAWKALQDYYEGKAADNIAQQAMARLNSIRLTRRNGVETYISQFNRCLEDLRETGLPYNLCLLFRCTGGG